MPVTSPVQLTLRHFPHRGPGNGLALGGRESHAVWGLVWALPTLYHPGSLATVNSGAGRPQLLTHFQFTP